MKTTRFQLLAFLLCTASQPAIALAQDGAPSPVAGKFISARPSAAPAAKPAAAPVAKATAAVAAKPATAAAVQPTAIPAAKIMPAPAAAQGLTLAAALAEAYRHNPGLQARRAELRGVDEQYAQAKSGFRPSVEGGVDYTSSHTDGNNGTHSSSDPKSLSVTVTQSVYSGGSTVAEVSRAENAIKTQRANLHVAEQNVLLDTVTVYMNVLRDQDILDLNRSNEKVLKSHLDASSERFRLGDITKTDVSQAEARYAAAAAARIASEGNLNVSRANFEQVVGLAADGLVKPLVKTALPGTLEEALAEGLSKNPVLAQAQYASAAAGDLTRSINGELLPQVDLAGSLSRTFDPATGTDDYLDQRTVLLQATVPFYSAGGATHSRIRQAKQVEAQRRREIDSASRAVRQSVINAWSTLTAANAQLEAQRAQIEAEKLAREGVRVEADYGSRTILDLLDAEQEYLNAEVARVISERDRTVAAYGLLAATGSLTAGNLKLDTPLYDPLYNFQKQKDRWAGTSVEKD